MSLINKQLIDFKVEAYQNGEFKTVEKKDVLGKWSVFFFYPADFTFVCPTELEDLNSVYDELKKINCEVYSVSADTHFVHKAWADATKTIANLKYTMLGDPTGVLGRFFEVFVDEVGQDLRGSFIVNPEGQIKAYEVHDMGIGRDANELVRKVQAAQYVAEHGGEVCPAKWKPGAKTLKPGIDLVGKL
ncbi:alkyl hydroperoxide reductase subunit C [Brachyspira innocens]|uniref:alkyl hydroperoxide reductase subunit C n=1 Tax=Brachyspira innocens TaxID=13264 RepID=UPI0026F0E2C0|nr:alkyl hydroperoxide reductase subunit C [Brachyspira innocens]